MFRGNTQLTKLILNITPMLSDLIIMFLFLGSKQNGVPLNDIVLPPWAKNDPREFIRVHRQVCNQIAPINKTKQNKYSCN